MLTKRSILFQPPPRSCVDVRQFKFPTHLVLQLFNASSWKVIWNVFRCLVKLAIGNAPQQAKLVEVFVGTPPASSNEDKLSFHMCNLSMSTFRVRDSLRPTEGSGTRKCHWSAALLPFSGRGLRKFYPSACQRACPCVEGQHPWHPSQKKKDKLWLAGTRMSFLNPLTSRDWTVKRKFFSQVFAQIDNGCTCISEENGTMRGMSMKLNCSWRNVLQSMMLLFKDATHHKGFIRLASENWLVLKLNQAKCLCQRVQAKTSFEGLSNFRTPDPNMRFFVVAKDVDFFEEILSQACAKSSSHLCSVPSVDELLWSHHFAPLLLLTQSVFSLMGNKKEELTLFHVQVAGSRESCCGCCSQIAFERTEARDVALAIVDLQMPVRHKADVKGSSTARKREE